MKKIFTLILALIAFVVGSQTARAEATEDLEVVLKNGMALNDPEYNNEYMGIMSLLFMGQLSPSYSENGQAFVSTATNRTLFFLDGNNVVTIAQDVTKADEFTFTITDADRMKLSGTFKQFMEPYQTISLYFALFPYNPFEVTIESGMDYFEKEEVGWAINALVFLNQLQKNDDGAFYSVETGKVLYSQITPSQKYGAYYYVNQGTWQNTSPANYNVGKKLAAAVFTYTDRLGKTKTFRIDGDKISGNSSQQITYSYADDNAGKLDKRVMFYLDEFCTFTKIEGIDKMFSAIRSRNVFLVPVIQGSAQLETNYGREGADNINNNCQMTMFSGFSPKSKDAEELSKALGNRTIMTGSVSSNKIGGNTSKTLQMMQQPLLSPDQIRTLRQGSFILMKTGFHPANFTLNFFTKWGICFNDEFSYSTEKRLAKQVQYATKISLEKAMND